MPNDSRWPRSVGPLRPRYERNPRLRSLLDRIAVQFALFGLFIAAMAAIMASAVTARETAITQAMVGQSAPYDIEASRDFTYTETDIASSLRLRQEVAADVPPVFDWQEGLAESIRDDVRNAFSRMRDAMQVRAKGPQPSQESLDDTARSTTLANPSPSERLRLARQLRAENFDRIFPTGLNEAHFDVLATLGFSLGVEVHLTNIVSEVMGHMILPNLRRLEREGEQGIYLRRLHHDKLLVEHRVTEFSDRFLGMDLVPRLVEDAARAELGGTYTAEQRSALAAIATALVRPNLTYNEVRTLEKRKAARESVVDQLVREDFRQGQLVLEKGRVVTDRDFRILRAMSDGQTGVHKSQMVAGLVALCLIFVGTLYAFGQRNIAGFRTTTKDLIFLGITLVLFMLITRIGTALSHAIALQTSVVPLNAWNYLIPAAAGAMLVRLVLSSAHAIVYTLVFSFLTGLMVDQSLYYAAFCAIGSFVGVNFVQQVRNRMAVMWSGVLVGITNGAILMSIRLFEGTLLSFETLSYVAMGFAGGLTSGLLISALLPLVESVFSYTTDIKLLELANLNHPALRELVMRAPGSYHHSMMVGSLCEAAAEAVGANALLARVGAYYHDIGKARNTQYFAENQRPGENPHDRLKPHMSALIIKSHVKDGIDMARTHRIPPEIQDFIAQHHGTSLIKVFYERARQQANGDEIDENDFRYPGPKPQSRETGICMLADVIEASTRAMPWHGQDRLKGHVRNMIQRVSNDGQLSECDLTFKDLDAIEKAFLRVLTGIYHHRPEYPGLLRKDNELPRQAENPSDASRRTAPARRGKQPALPSNGPQAAGEPSASAQDVSGQLPANGDMSPKPNELDSSSDVWDLNTPDDMPAHESLPEDPDDAADTLASRP